MRIHGYTMQLATVGLTQMAILLHLVNSGYPDSNTSYVDTIQLVTTLNVILSTICFIYKCTSMSLVIKILLNNI